MEEEEIEEDKNKKKFFMSIIFILMVIILLFFYWFIPFNTVILKNLKGNSGNYNFTLNNSEFKKMQFYENMRYVNSKISYKIYNCTIAKQNDAESAFDILSNKTILTFYPVKSDEEISVYCQEKNKFKEGMFIAGEGGPSNITKSGNFYVISHGHILLIKESKCERPNIAIHELLHALGFGHSENSNNIMYEILDCSQTIGEDIPALINELYSIPSYPDLVFENVSAIMHGKYLTSNISIRNNGLEKSKKAELNIYADGKKIKKIDLEPLEIGEGFLVSFKNTWISKIKIEKIDFYINASFNELEEKNNKISLEIN
jgi:hypothetical protein